MSMSWVTVSDENGDENDQHGLTDGTENEHGQIGVFVYVTKNTGFGDTVGQIVFKHLKRLDNGKFGA